MSARLPLELAGSARASLGLAARAASILAIRRGCFGAEQDCARVDKAPMVEVVVMLEGRHSAKMGAKIKLEENEEIKANMFE